MSQYITTLWIQYCKVRYQLERSLFLNISLKERDIEPVTTKRRTKNSVSSLIKFSCSIIWFYLVEPRTMIFPKSIGDNWNEWVIFIGWFHYSANLGYREFLSMGPFTKNFETATSLTRSIKTMRNWSTADSQIKLSWLTWNSPRTVRWSRELHSFYKIGEKKLADFRILLP